MKVSFSTLGCKVNQYESEALREKLLSEGFEVVSLDEASDVVIINTCAVTSEAERKCRQMIRRAISKNPKAFIAVMGCSSQLHPEDIAKISGVDFVTGNHKKLEVCDRVLAFRESKEKKEKPIIASRPLEGCGFEPMKIVQSERTRAYIKIEDGCDSKCTYCIIKTARGHIRSKLISDVISEAKGLIRSGYREIVLTGIEISGFGRDTGESLIGLLSELDSLSELDRVRLGSLDPAFLTYDFIDKIKGLKKLAPHFHLSLQSGCDRTLAAMKRRNNIASLAKSVEYLRNAIPDATFTADVIVGFPNESEADFEESRLFISSLSLLDFHIFAFSPRKGTEAAEMSGQIPEAIKEKRSKELACVRKESFERVVSGYIGRVIPVLYESFDGTFITGHTPNFIEVSVPSNTSRHSEIINTEITQLSSGKVIGRLME